MEHGNQYQYKHTYSGAGKRAGVGHAHNAPSYIGRPPGGCCVWKKGGRTPDPVCLNCMLK